MPNTKQIIILIRYYSWVSKCSIQIWAFVHLQISLVLVKHKSLQVIIKLINTILVWIVIIINY